MLLLISDEFVLDGNGRGGWRAMLLFTFVFFDKHISELVKVCQKVVSLPQLSGYSVYPEGTNPGTLALLYLTAAIGVQCLSRNTSSILMSWTDTRGMIPSPDLNFAK